jgi:hypothetical protein
LGFFRINSAFKHHIFRTNSFLRHLLFRINSAYARAFWINSVFKLFFIINSVFKSATFRIDSFFKHALFRMNSVFKRVLSTTNSVFKGLNTFSKTSPTSNERKVDRPKKLAHYSLQYVGYILKTEAVRNVITSITIMVTYRQIHTRTYSNNNTLTACYKLLTLTSFTSHPFY